MMARILTAIALTVSLSLTNTTIAQEMQITDANGTTVMEAFDADPSSSSRFRGTADLTAPPQAAAQVPAPAWQTPGANEYPPVQGQVVVPGGAQQAIVPGVPGPAVAPQVQPAPFLPKLGFMGRVVPGYGMEVYSVNYGSTAQRIGLERGDIIIRMDGREINSISDYEGALIDAASYGHGYVDLVVRNVRYRPGCSINPKFVRMRADLDLPRFVGAVPTPAVQER